MAVIRTKRGAPPSVPAALEVLKAAWAARVEPAGPADASLRAFLKARANDCRRRAEAYRREADAFDDMVRRVEESE